MIKVVFCLRRKEDMSLEQFQAYWRDVHGPLVREHREALRIARYVQLHTTPGEMTERLGRFRESAEPYDGVAEIWYESLDALQGLGKDPAGREASRLLFEDEKNFVDQQRSAIWVADELEVIAG